MEKETTSIEFLKKKKFVCLFVCFFWSKKQKKKRVIFEGKQKQICYLYPLNLKNK